MKYKDCSQRHVERYIYTHALIFRNSTQHEQTLHPFMRYLKPDVLTNIYILCRETLALTQLV